MKAYWVLCTVNGEILGVHHKSWDEAERKRKRYEKLFNQRFFLKQIYVPNASRLKGTFYDEYDRWSPTQKKNYRMWLNDGKHSEEEARRYGRQSAMFGKEKEYSMHSDGIFFRGESPITLMNELNPRKQVMLLKIWGGSGYICDLFAISAEDYWEGLDISGEWFMKHDSKEMNWGLTPQAFQEEVEEIMKYDDVDEEEAVNIARQCYDTLSDYSEWYFRLENLDWMMFSYDEFNERFGRQ